MSSLHSLLKQFQTTASTVQGRDFRQVRAVMSSAPCKPKGMNTMLPVALSMYHIPDTVNLESYIFLSFPCYSISIEN